MLNLRNIFNCQNEKPIEPTQTLSESITKAAELIREYEELKKHRVKVEKCDKQRIYIKYWDEGASGRYGYGDSVQVPIKMPMALTVIDFLLEDIKSQLKEMGVEVW